MTSSFRFTREELRLLASSLWTDGQFDALLLDRRGELQLIILFLMKDIVENIRQLVAEGKADRIVEEVRRRPYGRLLTQMVESAVGSAHEEYVSMLARLLPALY